MWDKLRSDSLNWHQLLHYFYFPFSVNWSPWFSSNCSMGSERYSYSINKKKHHYYKIWASQWKCIPCAWEHHILLVWANHVHSQAMRGVPTSTFITRKKLTNEIKYLWTPDAQLSHFWYLTELMQDALRNVTPGWHCRMVQNKKQVKFFFFFKDYPHFSFSYLMVK